MSDLRKKRKMSDGIRSSQKIKKRTSTYVRPLGLAKQETKISKKKIIIENDTHIFSTKKAIFKQFFFKNGFSFLRNNKKKIKWFFYIFVYTYLLFFVFNKLEKTKIDLSPRTETIQESKKIMVYAEPAYGQLGFDIIALKESREKKLDASISVEVEEKASGIITIFNNYSTEPQKLSPGTRFESVSGKIFNLGKDWIIIPGKLDEKPGEVDVKVYAEKSGPEYNIDITDFRIPGFEELGLTEKYNNIYALSLKKFDGGFNGERFIVGDEQKKIEIENLELELKEILIKRLDVEKTDRVILVSDSVQILFREPEILNSNILRQEAQIFALIIEKTQLEKFLKKEYLHDVYKDDISLLDFNGINFNYEGGELDFNKLKKLNINMSFSNTFIWDIDEDLVKESLLGLEKEYIPIILREFEEIDSAKIKIQPFWRKNISDNIKNIELNVE